MSLVLSQNLISYILRILFFVLMFTKYTLANVYLIHNKNIFQKLFTLNYTFSFLSFFCNFARELYNINILITAS